MGDRLVAPTPGKRTRQERDRLDADRIVSLVVQSLSGGADPQPGAGHLGPAELAMYRQIFVAGGTAAVRRALDPCWVQVGVGFSGPEQEEAFLGGPLLAAVSAMMHGRAAGFFFMRKSPGLRLRFRSPRGEDALAAAVADLVTKWLTAGAIASAEWGLYEAECCQFGGEEAMEAVHAHFTIDSLTVMRLLGWPEDGVPPLWQVSLRLIHHLMECLELDPWEQWDVWCQMRLAGRHPRFSRGRRQAALAAHHRIRPALQSLVASDETAWGCPPGPVRDWLAEYRDANATLAGRLGDLARRRCLLFGIRRVLPFLISFHWNRWAFSLEEQMSLVFHMESLLNPKGVAPTPPLGRGK